MMNENETVQPDVARGEFKKKFSLNVSIKWHSVEKVNLEDPPCPQKAPSILLPSSLKPPSALPPRLAPFPSVPPGFCRAVGGPTAPKLPYPRHSSPSSSQGKMMLAGCPVLLLQKMCEANGFGQPVYEMFYSHAGSDGFLYFNYKLHIHGAPTTFEGLVMILPGPSASTMLKEAERAAAQQVLQRVCNNQLAA